MLLTAVIFILVCGVAYTVSTRKSTPASGEPTFTEKPPHEILRPARASANERIAWETNIGGTESEQPIAVINKNNEIYIFGNTSSSDLDFTGATKGKTRGFGARLSLAGSTLAFTVFDFTIAKAIPISSGFALAGNEGSVAGIYLLSDDLTVSGKANMPATHSLTACGLYVYDNRYFLIAEALDSATDTKSLLMHIYTSGLSLEREKVFHHTYGLDFLDMMPYGDGYILAAAATFQDISFLTVARFGTLSEPAYTDLKLGYAYTPEAFVPMGAGFAAICDHGGACELLTLDSTLTRTSVNFLTSAANSNRKALFYAGAYYAYTGEKLLQLSDEGKTVGSIDFAPKKIAAFANNGIAAFVAGIEDTAVTFAFIGSAKSEVFSIAVTSPTSVALCAGANGLLFAADTSAKTSDCADFFGGSDVFISRLNL